MNSTWYRIENDFVIIRLLIKAKAHKTECLGVKDDRLFIAVRALPVDGSANIALIDFLAKLLKIPKSHIELTRGSTARFKEIRLPLHSELQKFLDDPENFCNAS